MDWSKNKIGTESEIEWTALIVIIGNESEM